MIYICIFKLIFTCVMCHVTCLRDTNNASSSESMHFKFNYNHDYPGGINGINSNNSIHSINNHSHDVHSNDNDHGMPLRDFFFFILYYFLTHFYC